MHRGNPSSTATSAAPSKGTSSQPSRRAARAGYSAVRSGEDVKMALSTSSGWKPFACCNARSSSSVALRIASLVLAVAVVAPRSPRRVLLMALADQLRLMVLTDPDLLKGRDPVEACRRAVAGGGTMIQVRLKDAAPREGLTLAIALVGAPPVPVPVNRRGGGDRGGVERYRPDRCGARAARRSCLTRWIAARCSAYVAEKMCLPSGCATKKRNGTVAG